MHLFKGSQFIVGAASRHFWPNSAIANGTTHVFHNAVSDTSLRGKTHKTWEEPQKFIPWPRFEVD